MFDECYRHHILRMAQTIWFALFFTPLAHGTRTPSLGDIIYLHVLGKQTIMLNSERAAKDLLDKRGLIYSDRPYLPSVELCVAFLR